MDRKLWTEAPGDCGAARSARRLTTWRRSWRARRCEAGAQRRAAGGVAGAGRAERGDRSPARRAAARASWRRTSSRLPAPADPETALLARERRGLVRRALALLPRPQRRAALLRFHAELPFETRGRPARDAPRSRRARACTARSPACARASGGLRAMFVLPGAQAAALGLTLIAAQQLPTAPAAALAIADAGGHRRRPASEAAAAWRRSIAPRHGAATRTRPAPRSRTDVDDVSRRRSASCSAKTTCSEDVKGPEGENTGRRPAARALVAESRSASTSSPRW